MSSTNKTSRLKLSQYSTGDHPSYVNDYNSDMVKIDAYATSTDDTMASLATTQALQQAVSRIETLESEVSALQQQLATLPSTYMPLNPPASAFDPQSNH